MASFDTAIDYILANEGVDSNDRFDRGGRTRYGITSAEAWRSGLNVSTITLDQAQSIYRRNYWKYDAIQSDRIATKMLDVAVNIGVSGGTKLVQRIVGVDDDGMFGSRTAAAVNAYDEDEFIARLSMALADYYVDIVKRDLTQLSFLKGWIRRAIRTPKAA